MFRSLTKEDVKEISGLMLKELKKRAKENLDIELSYSAKLKDFIFDKGYDKKYGARPLKRTIQSEIEDKLAEEVLSGKVTAGNRVTVSVSDGSVTFKKTGRRTAE